NDRPARVTLADVLCRMEQWDAAVFHLRAARDLPDPAATAEEDPGARLGSVLARLEQYEEAAEILLEAVSRFPAQYQLLSNLSFVAEKLGRYEEAEQAAGLAVESKSDLPEAWNHLGLALRGQGRVAEAIDAFQRAVALRPDFPLAEFNLAVTRMLAGDLAAGWAGYERRFDMGEAEVARFGEPRWDGSPLDGKTLLVVAEQGLGDTIQFSRFLCGLAARGARVLFRCAERLHPLLSTLTSTGQPIELIAPGQPLPPVDCWTPLLSIPGLLGISLSTIPQRPHWLAADPELQAGWSTWLREQTPEARCRVGIAWQGAPGYRRDRERSIPLAAFAPLTDVPGVQLVSLQLGPGTDQIPAAAGTVDLVTPPETFDQQTGAFQDTAALMQSLDLVICSDSAVAHLAGALGVPVWVALSRVPEWRWLLERTNSPWYPSMRLFRQMKRDDWNSVFEQMAAELKQQDNGE
ncbi:MAG: glycosyltransferase family protein, partial [Planctomycetaceae bacterium]|nr:glycosyltransferase family protein [Planctomycetaceae bacterium]